MIGRDGERFDDVAAYAQHLARNLPEAYLANRDFSDYLDLLGQVARGETTAEAAAAKSPALRRVGGACPCSKAVRWVVDDPTPASPVPVGA
jgi:hypothetical protein